MKKTLLITLLLSATMAFAQPQYNIADTLDRLPRRYYTPEWYADCPMFQDTDNDFGLLFRTGYIYGLQHPHTCKRQYVNEYFVDGQIEIRGMMCLVLPEMAPSGEFVIPEGAQRAPEWLTLLQGGAMHPGTGNLFPRDMTIVDSLRWDNVQPYLLRLPRYDGATADSDHFLFYAYEVLFPAPIVVDSVFYIAGSSYSNTYVDEQRHTAEGVIHIHHYDNYPTQYGAIAPVQPRSGVSDPCRFCVTKHNRMFTADGLAQTPENWYMIAWYPNSYFRERFRQITGPMFAIVDLYNVTVNSSDPAAGSVSGGGDYPRLSNATVTATPAHGHTFVRWNDGNTDNPRTLRMTGDVRLVAVFR